MLRQKVHIGVVARGCPLAQTAQTAFLVIRFLGAAYLFYFAYRMWTAPVRPLEIDNRQAPQRPLRLFLGSLSLTMGNPKPMIFFVALLPVVVHLQTLHFIDYVLISLAIIFILPVVLGAYSFAASRARRFFQKTSSIRLLNRGPVPPWPAPPWLWPLNSFKRKPALKSTTPPGAFLILARKRVSSALLVVSRRFTLCVSQAASVGELRLASLLQSA
jgi:hypothetical protein